MPTDRPQSLWARLPVSIQNSLRSDTRSPLQQWLNATCYDSSSLLRYAATQNPQDAYSIILAAAVASAVDASHDEHPIDLSYAVPLWHSLTQGRVSSNVIIDNPFTSTFAGNSGAAQDVSTAHIALGLAHGEVLDASARQRFLEQAIQSPTPIHLALLWFCIDLDVQERAPTHTLVPKYLLEWIRAFPADRDLPIFLLRKYLDSARRIGVAGALSPLNEYTTPQLSPREAAWAIAWDEAARAGAYSTCGELALQRAREFRTVTDLYRRWLLIYALHEDRRDERYTSSLPVARELLDLIYEVDDPNIPASLCASIAARTNHLKPVLREVLPYLKGPTPPLVRPALEITSRPQSFQELQEQGVAGVLLALRFAYKYPHVYQAASTLIVSDRSTNSSPTPILDNYESNLDFMHEILVAENDETSPKVTTTSDKYPTETSRAARSETQADASEKQPDDSPIAPAHPKAAETMSSTDNASLEKTQPPASRDAYVASARDAVPALNDGEKLSTGPFDHTIFATISSDKFTDESLVASCNDVQPTVSDVLLAAFLPDALRARADELLAQRISSAQLQERAFVRAIEDRTPLLPHSAWAIAELLSDRDPPQEAKAWMKRAAEHTTDASLRDERYRRLARHCAQRCHDLSQAMHFLEQSLTSDPAAIETIELLDTLYTRLGRTASLRALYQRALEHLPKQRDPSLHKAWKQRLTELAARQKT